MPLPVAAGDLIEALVRSRVEPVTSAAWLFRARTEPPVIVAAPPSMTLTPKERSAPTMMAVSDKVAREPAPWTERPWPNWPLVETVLPLTANVLPDAARRPAVGLTVVPAPAVLIVLLASVMLAPASASAPLASGPEA